MSKEYNASSIRIQSQEEIRKTSPFAIVASLAEQYPSTPIKIIEKGVAVSLQLGDGYLEYFVNRYLIKNGTPQNETFNDAYKYYK